MLDMSAEAIGWLGTVAITGLIILLIVLAWWHWR